MTTDNTHDLESAIRALKDRPSMEAELTCLRREVERWKQEVRIQYEVANDLRAEVAHLENRSSTARLLADGRDDQCCVHGLIFCWECKKESDIALQPTIDRMLRMESALREIAGHENCDHTYSQHEIDMRAIARAALAKDEGR